MKLKRLKPVSVDRSVEKKVKDKIVELLKEEIYIPLILEVGVKQPKFQNSMDDLIQAIRSGQLIYEKGKFKGKLNATLSRELRRIGAEWDRAQGSWSIPQSKLPVTLKSEIIVSKSKFLQVLDKVEKKLKSFAPAKIAEKLNLKETFDASLYDFDKKFSESLKDISIQPKLSADQISKISTEYNLNMQKYIQGWTEEETTRLRDEIQKQVMKGVRYEDLVDVIKKSYGVSVNKAKFLARQETNLMTAKLRETRFQDAGVTKYEWRTVAGSEAHPVRDSHQALDGKIFSWDAPPITTMPGKPQRRNHPGEDYNCRCIAVPVLEFE